MPEGIILYCYEMVWARDVQLEITEGLHCKKKLLSEYTDISMIKSLNGRRKTTGWTCKIHNHLFELNVTKPMVHTDQLLNVR